MPGKRLHIIAVAFVLAIAHVTGCKKIPDSPLRFTGKMGGMRYWHGSQSTNGPGGSTTATITDSFAISVISETTIREPLYGDTLHYSLAEDSFLCFSNTVSGTFGNHVSIYYYYGSNKLVYDDEDIISSGFNSSLTMSTP